MYDIFVDGQSYDDIFDDKSVFVTKGRLHDFRSELARLSRLV